MNGIAHIHAAFATARNQGRAALMPYFTLGYPDPPASLAILQAVAGCGSDLIELGLPFSDPLADGPAIQHSTQVALQNGINLAGCLEQVSALRGAGVRQPLLLMGYYNPILSFGVARFAKQAASAGADGLIVPDLPVEEAADLDAACRENGLALVYLLAPTSPQERIALMAERSAGFLYLVSLTGVTGVRTALDAGLAGFIERVRAVTSLPLAVGFGISNAEQARRVGKMSDGVIVGSALINVVSEALRLGEDPVLAAGEFVGGLRSALENDSDEK